MYWEYLPNPACHPERLPKPLRLRIAMSEEVALLIYLVQCRLFVQMSCLWPATWQPPPLPVLQYHYNAPPSPTRSIKPKRMIHSVHMSNAIQLTSYSPVGPMPSIPPVVKNSVMTPRA